MHKNRHENFAARKQRKREKRTRKSQKKAKPGAFRVLERGCGRCGGVRKSKNRTRVNHIAMQHMKKENRRKPSVFAGFLAGAEGLEPSARGFGVDVGKRTGNGEGARWRRFPSQAIKRRCWFGAAKKPGQKREGKPSLGYLKIFALLTNSKQREKMV